MERLKRWDLSVLYESFEDERFAADLMRAERLSSATPDPKEDMFSFFERLRTAIYLIGDVASFVNLTLMTDSEHAGAKRFSERILRLEDWLRREKTRFFRRIGAGDIISDDAGCELYAEYAEDRRKIVAHLIPEPLESALADLQRTGSYAWQALRNELDAVAVVSDSDGGATTRPLSDVRGLYAHRSQSVRRRAFEDEIRCCKTYEIPMAACLNAVKGEALSLVGLRGFDDVLDQMLFENRMDRETLEAMLNSVRRHLPIFRDYLKGKARRLGFEESLHYRDLTAPTEDVISRFDRGESREMLIEIFERFSPEMGGLFERAFEERWIDSEPRRGKISGALCVDLLSHDCSRVLVNDAGTLSDISAVAHEMGHAFLNLQLRDVPALFRDAPTPICEMTGIFNETVFHEAMLRDCPADSRHVFLEASLSELTQGIADVYSRFLFEKEVFERRKESNLTAADFNEIMSRAQRAAYGDGLREDGAHPYMWMRKPHYYIPDYHYYNFPYIFGLLFARGLYCRYSEEPKSFFARYKTFLANSCKGDVLEIAGRIGVDLRDDAFWDSAFESIAEKVREYLA
ncbi:MAG: M3 family metallopeptidase [Clostridiales Family XIII bacterium]|nr:M3 family metallopeptidase [Clostridiales Family XIII bacterium]